MAHILVYLQRTPQGLHPGSALALCIARDIASNRGASITALCPGDAGTIDGGTVRTAGRFGADVMVFFGPNGLADTIERLAPVHLLTPWSTEGLAAVQDVGLGAAVPRWICTARPPGAGADTVTGIVAGTLPWHALDAELDAEYLGDVDASTLPDWVGPAACLVQEGDAPGFSMVSRGPLHFVAGAKHDAGTQETLERLGAVSVATDDLASITQGSLLWFSDGAQPLPDALQACAPHVRTIVLAGEDGGFDPSWMHAQLVLPGPWEHALARLQEPLWRAALA
ncbi:MAG: hypothetical protein JKY37_26080 [Nannocystaceae bacterium]|nr:hypothetical protein [Nannocystaceae bacterium]